MKTTRKLWLCVGAFTTLTAGCSRDEHAAAAPAAEPAAAASESPAPAPAPDVFKGDFSGAVSKLLAGEGGEEGMGTYFANGNIVIPPLDTAQITEAFTGNTLRRNGVYAVHLEAGGKMSGWENKYEPTDTAKCASGNTPEHFKRDDGTCVQRSVSEIPAGEWTVKDGKFCATPALARAADGKDCVSVFLVLDDIALFDGENMIGKGNKLVQGKQLDQKI